MPWHVREHQCELLVTVSVCVLLNVNLLLGSTWYCPRSQSSAQWDFWQSGRVYFLGEESDDNIFKNHSELCRTGMVPAGTLLNNGDIVSVTADASSSEQTETLRVTPSTRAAQRGPDPFMQVVKHLIKSSTVSSHVMVKERQEVVIVDLHVHSGDHAHGSLLASQDFNITHVTWHYNLLN